jgi:oxygen-independent coproporphyrinogen-3 oxidase
VFFGGGTPSLLAPEHLTSILAAVDRQPGAEVTVECNPENVDRPLLEAYLEAGVNRLSFGVQSMVPAVLVALGRTHHRENVLHSAFLAKELGFRSWNIDLIFGGVGESSADWQRTLDESLALDAPHLSAYALTVEAGTPLAADARRHPDDDDQAEKYLAADRACASRHLGSYEISNWARPGHECRHNMLYWDQGPYRGIGCAAHSHEAGRRWWNVRSPDRYIAAIEGERSPIAAGETLDPDARRLESLQLSLRTRRGVPTAALEADDRAACAGLLVEERGRLHLTPSGRMLANEVAIRLR